MLSKKLLIGKVKKTLALVLTSAMVATLCPNFAGGILQVKANAYFEKNKYNTCIGTSKINGAKNGSWDYVLYGKYGNYPFKARVLSKSIPNDTKDVKDIENDVSPYIVDVDDTNHEGHIDIMLLDSMDDVGTMKFGGDSDRYYTSMYDASLIRDKLDNNKDNSIFKTAFSGREQNAIPRMRRYYRTVEKSSTKYLVDGGFIDHVFILGLEDILNGVLGLGSASLARKDHPFWTRAFRAEKNGSNWTPDDSVAIIATDGSRTLKNKKDENYVYPAFCIDSENVMFSTVVDKNLGTQGATYKLTITDPQMKIAVSDGQTVFRKPGTNTITVPYRITGANADKAEYVSALVLDSSENIIYYENKPVAENSNSGTVTFDIPNSVSLDQLAVSNRLYILAEDINDSETTDYSSEKIEITSVNDIVYKGDGKTDSITATVGTTELAKLKIVAPKNLVYDGKAKKAQTNAYDESIFPGTIKITYYEDEINPGNELNDKPVEVGKYVVRLSYDNRYFATISFVITGVPAVKAPTAKSLKETGSAQKLVNAGSATNGTIKYALGSDAKTAPAASKFTTTIPKGTKIGTYYVWYRVDGAANYTNVAAKCITVKIAAHTHDNLKKIAAKEPSGSTNGNIAYYYCSQCNKYYSDKKGTKEIKKNSWVILAKNKTFKDSKSKGKYKVTSKGSKNPTVTYIGCTDKNATSVKVPDTVKNGAITYKVTEIGKGALVGKTKIKTITVGNNVKKIGDQAFSGCKGATKVTLGKNVTTIGTEAFSECTSLKELTLPKNTKTLGMKFLNKCNKKMKLTIKNTKMTKSTVKGEAFKGMTNKSGVTVIVPKGMKSSYTKLFQTKGLGKKITVKASTK